MVKDSFTFIRISGTSFTTTFSRVFLILLKEFKRILKTRIETF